jgi:hypothetical protein
MRLNWILQTALCAGALAVAPAFAQPYTISSPTAAYTGNTTVVPISVTGLPVGSLIGGGQTLTFSTNLTQFTVPGTWAAWGSPPDTESANPLVLASAINQTALTIALSPAATTFGFEIEPANVGGLPPSAYPITATFFNGATTLGSINRSLTYNGARVFAFSSSTPITSVQISSPLAAGGFALSQFRVGALLIGAPPAAVIPTLGLPELGALGLLLAGAGALLARRQSAEA